MWIQVRTIDGQHSHTIDGLSKLTTIEELRQKLVDLFDAPPERQRLFYRGKQLEDEHTLFDYNVGLNTIVQLMVKPVFVEQKTDDAPEEEAIKEAEQIESNNELPVENEIGENEETTYKVGDAIDCKDLFMAAWFPGKVIRVERKTSAYTKVEPPRSEVEKDTLLDDGFIYSIMYDGYEEDEPTKCSIRYIRPRAHCKIPLGDLILNDVVMVHYNVDDPDKLGHWYDAIITSVCNERKKKELVATLFIGEDMIPIADCNIRRIIEVFKIEKPGTQVNIDENPNHRLPDARVQKYECDVCEDRPVKRCNGCGCKACKLKKDADKLLLCDDCDTGYHIYCLKPPLTEIPEADEWYCPECKLDTSEVVGAGEKLKASKKKSKMASATGNTSRDWGRGMACVGRTKFCNIVPSNHFGPIPGIEVGMCWKFRVQVSEAGVHRPHVSGIAGTGEKGAYSIVLSGGYEDDRDDGDVFTYTGSGGRDLSGNKRTADQSCDQILTRFNLALARNCNAKLDVKNGATAQDWKKGKPIRVVRNAKAAKHSKYAPEEGNRYDGIYKMEKYWPEMGKSGFLVWRYQLRRDDESPAPWTKAGKKRIEELGFQIVYPEGWQEAQELKAKKAEETKKGKGKGKRKRTEVDSGEETEDENADPNKMKSPPAKKLKAYSMNAEMEKLVNKDTLNAHLWKQAVEHMEEGVTKYLSHVEELFCCICCQDLVYKPITTECKHNICKVPHQRRLIHVCNGPFKADVFSCSACRTELGKDYPMKTNDTLITILNKLFPGYEAGR